MVQDYSKGKVYKITGNKSGLFYIGSTVCELSDRLRWHRTNYKYGSEKMGTLKLIFDKDGTDNVTIELIRDAPSENKRELCKYEREEFDKHFKKNPLFVNVLRPYVSEEERKREEKEKRKQYEILNKEKIKEKRSEKTKCPKCQKEVLKRCLQGHLNRNVCEQYIAEEQKRIQKGKLNQMTEEQRKELREKEKQERKELREEEQSILNIFKSEIQYQYRYEKQKELIKCSKCGKEYTKHFMSKHIKTKTCQLNQMSEKERKQLLEKEKEEIQKQKKETKDKWNKFYGEMVQCEKCHKYMRKDSMYGHKKGIGCELQQQLNQFKDIDTTNEERKNHIVECQICKKHIKRYSISLHKKSGKCVPQKQNLEQNKDDNNEPQEIKDIIGECSNSK